MQFKDFLCFIKAGDFTITTINTHQPEQITEGEYAMLHSRWLQIIIIYPTEILTHKSLKLSTVFHPRLIVSAS